MQENERNMQQLLSENLTSGSSIDRTSGGCRQTNGTTLKSNHLCRAVLSFALLFGSGYAFGQWSYVSRSEHGTTYVDTSTIRITSNGAALWTLYDAEVPYLERENEYVQSTKVQTEFDCQKTMARSLNTVKYSDRMAMGKVVDVSSIPQVWEPVNPNTGRSILIQLACRSK